MHERLFARLDFILQTQSVILASVRSTRGATPRKIGSKMLITESFTEFSIGGGMAEARVIDAARALLASEKSQTEIDIDLTGKPDSAGVCGGTMQVSLRRWENSDQARANYLKSRLAAGHEVELSASDIGIAEGNEIVKPNIRLLIVGGGHCALALCDVAQHLEFDIWVFDPYPSTNFIASRFSPARFFSGDFDTLSLAQDTPRKLYVVLLNRNFIADISTLKILCKGSPEFIGMMGSKRRIAEVTSTLACQGIYMPGLRAPIGIGIQAETPHEIAISILAQLIQHSYEQ